MKNNLLIASISIMFFACSENKPASKVESGKMPIVGTWKLLTGTLIENGDTTVTQYTDSTSFIKIINDTHFAFLLHDVRKGKDSGAVYSSGGGRYTLKDSSYTEHLEYCSAREWEGHDFNFTLQLSNDTLVQSGVEKVESAGVNRTNTEKYVRVKE